MKPSERDRSTDDANTADLERVADAVTAVEEKLERRQDALSGRMDEEFRHLRTILEYLLDRTDDLSARVEAADAERGATGETGGTARLEGVRHEACRQDISRAACEACGTPVEVALLTAPACPECGCRIVGIEPSEGWFGLGTDTLVVEAAVEGSEGSGDQRSAGRSPATDFDGLDWEAQFG